jgi:hypothetical protein
MHDYSLDTPVRRYVHYVLALAAFTVPHAFTTLSGYAIPGNQFGYPISVGATFTILYLIFDHWAWKKLYIILKIPNLSGEWQASGISSYPDPQTGQPSKFNMRYTIKQSFSRIEVYGETDTSTSRSMMASLELDHAVCIFRYAFENQPKNTSNNELQRHPGLIELRIISPSQMAGDYFSGKHRLRYGELTFTKL